MERSKVLLVGEHPLGTTGNCGMMTSILADLDPNRFEASCAVVGHPGSVANILFKNFSIPIIPISRENDFWGNATLLEIVKNGTFDVLFFIGIDLWRYIDILPEIINARNNKRFRLGGLFPYDFQNLRDDYVEVIKSFDFPCVYSEYGYNMLKEHIPLLRYYRPKLHLEQIWTPRTKERIDELRHYLFHGTTIPIDVFMIGFVGINQYRKDPQKLIKAFGEFTRKYKDSVLYMHTEKAYGVYNIPQCAVDCGIESGKLLTKPDNVKYPISQMPDIFGCFDLYANCSMQEGLSWTVIESMLCGVPAVISDSTAHKELMVDEHLMVKCKTSCLLPISSKSGQNWIDAFCCEHLDICKAFEWYYNLSDKDKEEIKQLTLDKGQEWKKGCHNPNDLLEDILKAEHRPKKIVKDIILFAQHSAAGDVFMTTRCFRGIKERHPGLPLHYMTQEKYHDIVTNNPFIDEILPWEPQVITDQLYRYYYNPHSDIILPGHWGRNCNSILSDFYWKILRVEPDDFFIEQVPPSFEKIISTKSEFCTSINNWVYAFDKMPVAVVHTTGGDPAFRTYKYMGDVSFYLKSLGYHVIQLGGKDDYPADANTDFRGVLSYRETAWIMARARIAVTVDSFISHLAGYLGIDQVCLFGSGNYIVVKPWQKPGSALVCMVPDYIYDCKGLGPCSASVRDCALVCTGRHDPKDITIAIDRILSGEEGEIIMREETT